MSYHNHMAWYTKNIAFPSYHFMSKPKISIFYTYIYTYNTYMSRSVLINLEGKSQKEMITVAVHSSNTAGGAESSSGYALF